MAKGVWIVAEQRDGVLQNKFELAGAAGWLTSWGSVRFSWETVANVAELAKYVDGVMTIMALVCDGCLWAAMAKIVRSIAILLWPSRARSSRVGRKLAQDWRPARS